MPLHVWAVGASVYVGGAGLIVLGENVVKLSSKYDDDASDEATERCRQWRLWTMGVASFVVGNLAHFVAFMFAAQSTLESLGSSVLLWNLLIASRINRERICRGHIVATLVILAGTGLALLFGPHSSAKHDLPELLQLFHQPAFVLYEFVLVVLVLVLQGVYIMEERRIADGGRTTAAREWVHQFSFAGVSAGIGSNSVLLSKCVAEATRSRAAGGSAGGDAASPLAPAVLIAVWLTIMAFWLYRLNHALTRFPALFIVPVMHAIWMTNSIVGGSIFFGEFDGLAWGDVFGFGFGVLVILVGVFLMPSHEPDPTMRESKEADELGLLYYEGYETGGESPRLSLDEERPHPHRGASGARGSPGRDVELVAGVAGSPLRYSEDGPGEAGGMRNAIL